MITYLLFFFSDMLKNPPRGFEEVVRSHFYLQRKAILEQGTKWGVTNPKVKDQLGTLKSLLSKLKRPKGL